MELEVQDYLTQMGQEAAEKLKRSPSTSLGFGFLYYPESHVFVPFYNLITTAGDQYQAKKIATGISPANPSAPTAANGIKLGTGTTAAAKSGAGAALVTYLSGSNVSFTTAYPQTSAVAGTDTGWIVTYRGDYAAGVITTSALTEAVIVNDAGTNATSTAANTYSRVVFAAQDLSAGTQPLAVIWNHLQLGS